MDAKYTNRVPESQSLGSFGNLGVSNHELYLCQKQMHCALADHHPTILTKSIVADDGDDNDDYDDVIGFQGDLRETQDGCDGCPGPLGG